jgi:hypothetical protein
LCYVEGIIADIMELMQTPAIVLEHLHHLLAIVAVGVMVGLLLHFKQPRYRTFVWEESACNSDVLDQNHRIVGKRLTASPETLAISVAIFIFRFPLAEETWGCDIHSLPRSPVSRCEEKVCSFKIEARVHPGGKKNHSFVCYVLVK